MLLGEATLPKAVCNRDHEVTAMRLRRLALPVLHRARVHNFKIALLEIPPVVLSPHVSSMLRALILEHSRCRLFKKPGGERGASIRARFRRMLGSIASFAASAVVAFLYFEMGFWCLAVPVARGYRDRDHARRGLNGPRQRGS
jgi:hypothetical protein